MSHTYASNRIHVVFSTKGRQKRLTDELRPKLWAYMAGVAHNHGFESTKIGGAVDHVHALLHHSSIDAVSQGGAGCERLFIEVAKRHQRNWRQLRLAGRLWIVQCERIANGWSDQIHRESGGPPRQTKL